MNKLILLSLISVFSLSTLAGCNDDDDGGKLAGDYVNTVTYATGSKGEKKITLDYKKPNYDVSYQANNGPVQSVGLMKKDGDYLVTSDNRELKKFEIKDNGSALKSLSEPSQTTYLKK